MRAIKKARVSVHDHSATRGKRKVYATVRCDRHGKALAVNPMEKVIIVPIPSTKRERMAGCPVCAAEKR